MLVSGLEFAVGIVDQVLANPPGEYEDEREYNKRMLDMMLKEGKVRDEHST